jgi:Ca2+-binding EF-hand superfamily protein
MAANKLKLDAKLMKDLDVLEAKIQALTQDADGLKTMWRQLDYNGNGLVSLAEIDKLVGERYPLLNKKPALMRAYKHATGKPELASTDCALVEFSQLPALLKGLFYYNRVYHVFDKIDTDDDRRIDLAEFKAGFAVLGLDKKHKPDAVFNTIDLNAGGIILFDEFCAWYSTHGNEF